VPCHPDRRIARRCRPRCDDLTGTNLTGANPNCAALNAANLTDAVLTISDLLNADLFKVALTGAKPNCAAVAGATLGDVQSDGITGVPAALPAGWRLVAAHIWSGPRPTCSPRLSPMQTTLA